MIRSTESQNLTSILIMILHSLPRLCVLVMGIQIALPVVVRVNALPINCSIIMIFIIVKINNIVKTIPPSSSSSNMHIETMYFIHNNIVLVIITMIRIIRIFHILNLKIQCIVISIIPEGSHAMTTMTTTTVSMLLLIITITTTTMMMTTTSMYPMLIIQCQTTTFQPQFGCLPK